jgi:hypothetical protein
MFVMLTIGLFGNSFWVETAFGRVPPQDEDQPDLLFLRAPPIPLRTIVRVSTSGQGALCRHKISRSWAFMG